VNFTNALSDTNYAAIVSIGSALPSAGRIAGAGLTKTTTTCSTNVREPSASAVDDANVQVAIFR
jgi:hypothetical protein